MKASPGSLLPPAAEYRGRLALRALGWMGTTGWPASRRVSTTRPEGRSRAMGIGGGRAEARQLAPQLRQAFGRVRHAALPAHLTRGVEDAHGVRLTRPVEADEEIHCAPLGDGETLRGERSCRSLTIRRSGLQVPLAQHPVAGLGLSSFDSGEQVSQWPSSGKRTWLSPNPSRSTFPRMRGLTGSAQEIRSRIAPRIDDRSPRTGLS